MMISISYLKPLREACNITSVNTSLVSENDYKTVPERVKTLVGVTMAFTNDIKIVTTAKFWQNIDGTTTAFAECRRRFRRLNFSS